MTKSWIGKGLIEAVRLERERNPQAKAADMARVLGRSREAIRQALLELGLPTKVDMAKFCTTCGKKLDHRNRSGRCRECYFSSEVKDAVVRGYLRGDKTRDIMLEHKIANGSMYNILRTRNVKLRSEV